ncbi:MAG: hypothetical protein EOO77_22875 [Oxalobacteraceae bacterium]|nr:MAG: hypothetical protein EOO77_22875 [Oxalobacteraceae bacterium]
MTETGWVIERRIDPNMLGHHYVGVVCGHLCWNSDAWALRFARRSDANRAYDALVLIQPTLFECINVEFNEHLWELPGFGAWYGSGGAV